MPNRKSGEGPSRHDVLVLGDYRQTLAIVRSLGRAGYNVTLGSSGTCEHARSSIHVRKLWKHPAMESRRPEVFLKALSAFLASHPEISSIFPVGEKEISFLSANRAELPNCNFVMPAADVVTTCLNKVEMFGLALQLDVPVAEFAVVQSADELMATVRQFGFPCVLKPESEKSKILGQKAVLIHSEQELAQTREAIANESRWIAQKRFSGVRHNVYFFAIEGELVDKIQVQIERTDRPDGTGYAVEGVTVAPSDELAKYTQKFIQRLNYTGAGCAQFLVDPGSQVSFLEINARLGANFIIASDCGLDLAKWWLELVTDGRRPVPRTDFPLGRRYCWLTGDLLGLKESLLQGQLSFLQTGRWFQQMLATWLRSDVHVTWSISDPGPSVSMLWRMVVWPVRYVTSRFTDVKTVDESAKSPAEVN